MRMLLLSHTLNNKTLKQALLKLLTKPAKEHKALIIHQVQFILDKLPQYTELANTMIQRDPQILNDLGIKPENINTYDVANNAKPDLKDIDLLWILGGNNFYYLKQIKENEYMEDIRDYVLKDKVYIGTSAGSMIMGPGIDVNLTRDDNIVDYHELAGFGLAPFYIVPHWDSKDDELRDRMLRYGKEIGKQVIPLTDQQGVIVTDNETKII